MIKGIYKDEDGNAIAQLFAGVEAMVHIRAVNVGGNSVTPLSVEGSKTLVTVDSSLEYLGPDGKPIEDYKDEDYVICPTLRLTGTAGEVGTTDFASADLKSWYVDKLVERHNPVQVEI